MYIARNIQDISCIISFSFYCWDSWLLIIDLNIERSSLFHRKCIRKHKFKYNCVRTHLTIYYIRFVCSEEKNIIQLIHDDIFVCGLSLITTGQIDPLAHTSEVWVKLVEVGPTQEDNYQWQILMHWDYKQSIHSCRN